MNRSSKLWSPKRPPTSGSPKNDVENDMPLLMFERWNWQAFVRLSNCQQIPSTDKSSLELAGKDQSKGLQFHWVMENQKRSPLAQWHWVGELLAD